MIHDLHSLARARERQIQLSVNGHRRVARRSRRRNRAAALVRRAACRLGSWMVSVGRRLECYELPLLSESDYARG